MGNILTKETKDNVRYTEFENNQVLTADQLNDLFRYLDIQSRLTRTRGIGVGIICGLEIGLSNQDMIVVSMGSAITTDGDLLHFSEDQSFDRFTIFEDINSKYDYFHTDLNVQIPLFQLISASNKRTDGKKMTEFAQQAGAPLKDFVGVLYLEDYDKDADLCTGQDCDNKGIECVKELKVLLVHKDQLAELLTSIPEQNKNYFSLDDIDPPRVMIKKTMKKYEDIKGAFSSALNVKDSIVGLLGKAYEVCKNIVDDELNSSNPVEAWKGLLDQQIKNQDPVYIEYVYDYLKDLCCAYNELRESLFNDDSICCPPVELFPKHVLMGAVKVATVRKTIVPSVLGARIPANLLIKLGKTIRFDSGELIRRFQPVNIDADNRHSFYESPVLKNKEEMTERIIFCFKRIDTMIRNFDIPEAVNDIKKVNDIRIIPSYGEDCKLGERTIPFYYKYNPNLPVNAYWNFEDNIRRKENRIKYFFSSAYGLNKDFLQQNLLPYSFFRVEGHIGFKYQDVEEVLNRIIDENNLPVNIVSLQIEEDIERIPVRPWYFPELHTYEHFVRQSFVDQIDQADLVNTGISENLDEKIRTTVIAEDADRFKKRKTQISESIKNFSTAKSSFLTNLPVTRSKPQEIEKFRTDVMQIVNTATDLKKNTKEFGFSNTSIPHDFLINADILRKSDLIADLLDQRIKKKKEELILSNFLKLNPGMEHAGGVKTGGTFILVYTAADDRVVADFMLPYASIDKDIVPDPPKPRPLPPTRIPIKFNPNIIEIEPTYIKAIDKKVGVINDRVKFFENKIDLFDTKLISNTIKFDGIETKFSNVDVKFAGLKAIAPGVTGTQPGVSTPAFDFDSKFADLFSRFDDHETKFTKLNSAFDTVNVKVKEHDVKFGEFNNQLSTHGTRVGDLNNRLAGVETKSGSQESKLSDLFGKLTGVENKVNSNEAKVTDIGSKMTLITNRVVESENKVGGFGSLLSGLDQKLNNQVNAISVVSNRIGTVEGKVNTHDTEFAKVNTRFSTLGGVGRVVIPPIR